MNVSDLARQLRVRPQDLLDILPTYGFDIGKKAVKIDNRVAAQIIQRWKHIKREMDEKRLKELEEAKQKEKLLRKESGVTIECPDLITVREFAERMDMPVTQLITELMKNGILANQNQNLDFDTAAVMGSELGFSVKREVGGDDSQKDAVMQDQLQDALSRALTTEKRAPVIVVMGHVDHGKTKLLDTIRETNVIAGEAGGITQHIGAYQTVWKDPKTKEKRALTFIDTPGHEAFTVMRSRGAKVADIAILVVAADDGVKQQTIEVIQIIKAAKLPFVVAINKIDKEAADLQRVKTELSQHGIIPEEWGGTVPVVGISAKEKLNIDQLLDVLLLMADMNADTIMADSTMPAAGTIIESHVDKGMGPVATVLVQAGTLRKNDPLVVNGEIYGKVRAMKDYTGENLDEAGPSVPAQIIGFKVAPVVGDVLDVSRAGQAKMIDVKAKRSQQTGAERTTITSSMSDENDEGGKKTLNLIIKADVLGSLEAIIGSLEKIQHDEVGIRVIGKGLGNITDDDIQKAKAGQGTVVAFDVRANPLIESNMREQEIPFLQFTIIYDLIDWAKLELEKLLDKEKIVKETGIAKILAIFREDKQAMTIGARVEDGKIVDGGRVRVKRNGELVGIGKIGQLQTGQQKVKEVPAGVECGIRYEGKVKVEVGDVIEVYTEETKVRKIEFK